jgi:hypothetical protein
LLPNLLADRAARVARAQLVELGVGEDDLPLPHAPAVSGYFSVILATASSSSGGPIRSIGLCHNSAGTCRSSDAIHSRA